MTDAELAQGNEKARLLYLSGPERRKGVTLEYDAERKVWIKGGKEQFSDKLNGWVAL
jgi:hypothetical protein